MFTRLIFTCITLTQFVVISPLSAAEETKPEAAHLKVAVVSMNAKTDKEANIGTMTSYIKEAAEQGVHLILLPEGCLQGNPAWGIASYQPTEEELRYVRDTAETVPGPSTERLIQVARSHQILVMFGLTEKGTDGRLYTTSVLLGPTGVLGSHRKTKLWDTSLGGNEQWIWSTGDKDDVVESPIGKVGLMICIEMYYNVGPRLALAGADFIATISHWPTGYESLYESRTVSNAREAARWHFVSQQTGPVGHAVAQGNSRIIRPDGVIVADIGTAEGMLVAETDIKVHLTPVIDFNGNGIVDIKDLLRLIEHWGQSDLTIDICPLPYGDGKIDVNDLEVLMGYWGQEVNDPTLVAGWKLDEIEGMVAHNITGISDGTLHGEPVWQPQEGKIDGALLLDGIDDFISTAFVLNPTDGPFSVFAWIKGGAPGQVVLSQKGYGNLLSADISAGYLIVELKSNRRGSKELMSQTVITDGNWHHVGLVWDGLYRTLYVDGVIAAIDTTVHGTYAGSTNGLYIGAGKGLEVGSFWSGLIDDVRLYNRVVVP